MHSKAKKTIPHRSTTLRGMLIKAASLVHGQINKTQQLDAFTMNISSAFGKTG
jgi:hypothetical protein